MAAPPSRSYSPEWGRMAFAARKFSKHKEQASSHRNEASSVVWGMPGAVVTAGLADRVLPLNEVVPQILRIAARN